MKTISFTLLLTTLLIISTVAQSDIFSKYYQEAKNIA